MEQNQKIIIIGGGVAAKEAAIAARKQDPSASIIILAKEQYLPYYRPFLTEYLTNDLNEKRFFLADKNFYHQHKINVYLNDPIVSIIPEQKKVITQSHHFFIYDRLILAMGSYNFIPFPHVLEKKGVFSIKTLDEAKEVKRFTNIAQKAIIIGGGLLGLEAAWALKRKGLDVTIVEQVDRILPLQLDATCSIYVEKMIISKGIHLQLGTSVQKILGESRVSGVKLSNGNILPCDLLLFSIGVRSNTTLVKNIGIDTHHGILVNEKMETSIPTIYAAGDVCEFQEKVTGTWPPALLQGKVAGTNAAGGMMLYTPPISSTMISAFETKIFSIGDIRQNNTDNEYQHLSFKDSKKNIYRQLYFLNDQLAGGILIGDIHYSTKLIKGLQTKISIHHAKILFDM